MVDKRVESIKEIDFSGLKVPMIAVYKHPEDYPDKCVARVFDLDKPTNVVMVKMSVEEITMDINHNSGMIFLQRGAEDVPSLVGVWV